MPAIEALLTTNDVRRLLGGICRATLRNWIERGIVPRPVKLGGHVQSRVRFRPDEVQAAIDRLGQQVVVTEMRRVTQ
jgi:predicted DNA-binding transcriptional regulator AlpA